MGVVRRWAMEDRITPGLYLEMTGCPLEDYVDHRVDAVLGRDGADRATWWRNVNRDRTDLPRTLPEFDYLAVYEVDERFEAPVAPPGVSGLLFRHYPRPGQGRITGRPTLGLSLVLISPTEPDRAQELRDWGDFVHIRAIAEAAVPGYTMITPYENATGADPRYLHCYEMDTDRPEEAFRSMTPLVERLLNVGGTPMAESEDASRADQLAAAPEGFTEAFRAWGFHRALRIDYVNSFVRIGERI
jgi:hypothetical protein